MAALISEDPKAVQTGKKKQGKNRPKTKAPGLTKPIERGSAQQTPVGEGEGKAGRGGGGKKRKNKSKKGPKSNALPDQTSTDGLFDAAEPLHEVAEDPGLLKRPEEASGQEKGGAEERPKDMAKHIEQEKAALQQRWKDMMEWQSMMEEALEQKEKEAERAKEDAKQALVEAVAKKEAEVQEKNEKERQELMKRVEAEEKKAAQYKSDAAKAQEQVKALKESTRKKKQRGPQQTQPLSLTERAGQAMLDSATKVYDGLEFPSEQYDRDLPGRVVGESETL